MRSSSLVVAVLAAAADALVARKANIIPSAAAVQVETDPAGVTWPWRVFRSSDQTPPKMTVTASGDPLAEGYIFMTPATTNTSIGYAKADTAFIMDVDGELIFALTNVTGPTDFRRQHYNGKPYLTYWSGYNSQGTNVGHGYGQTTFLDDKYQSFVVDPDLGLDKNTVTENPSWSTDIHEHQMTPHNTLVISAYNNTPCDLSSVGGPADGWIVDAVVAEIDIATQEVLFIWHAADHLPLNASHQPVVSAAGNGTETAPWDWFHINAIQAVGPNYLVNSRHHWATYLVSGEDGSIIWRIEGETGGSFGPLPIDGTFRWQHFARAHNVTDSGLDLSMFDNHASALDNGTAPSRGLVYHLELPPDKSVSPKLLRRIETPSQELYAESQGSYQATLSNGNQILGYGQIAITREYGPTTDGSDLRWEAQFGGMNEVQSYRGFKETWSATPAGWDPSLVVDGKAYVSWNGATEVTGWNVYVGNQIESLSSAGVAVKQGFETMFEVPSGARFVQVAAVQGELEVRRSNVVAL